MKEEVTAVDAEGHKASANILIFTPEALKCKNLFFLRQQCRCRDSRGDVLIPKADRKDLL